MLLLPRRHADPLLHEVRSTSIRSAPFPTPSWSTENRRRGTRRAGVRTARHRHLRRGPLLRRLRRVCQGRARRHPDPHHGRQPRPGDGAPLHLLPTLWFRNTWSWGYAHERPSRRACRAMDARSDARRCCARSTDSWATVLARLRAGAPSCCSPRTRRNTRAAVRTSRTRRPSSRTAFTMPSSTAEPTRSTRRSAAPRPPRTTSLTLAPRRDRDAAAAPLPTAASASTRSRRFRRASCRAAQAEADEFYAAVAPDAIARGCAHGAAAGVRRACSGASSSTTTT